MIRYGVLVFKFEVFKEGAGGFVCLVLECFINCRVSSPSGSSGLYVEIK